jgi:hypothetical protein
LIAKACLRNRCRQALAINRAQRPLPLSVRNPARDTVRVCRASCSVGPLIAAAGCCSDDVPGAMLGSNILLELGMGPDRV